MRSVFAARAVFTDRRDSLWIKLCGVRDVETAVSLAELRPDAIGLNFFAESVRYVSVGTAAEICGALPRDVLPVGVFVNAAVEEIVATIDATGIMAVQLHGDEPPSLLARLREARPELAILRAWRVGAEGLSPLSEYLAECAAMGATPDAVLVDAKVAGSYGGTGHTAPWHLLSDFPRAWPPLILAGGLVPENVAAACEVVHPFGVDTAGGVESAPGVKDPVRAAAFIAALRSAPA